MQLNRILIVWLALCGIVCAEGLRNIVGIYTNGQTLATGRVAVSTNNLTFWVGNATSNAVKVGDVAWSNSVSASVTNGLASTNFVNAAISDRPVTNAWNTLSLVITNSHTGTNAWLRSDDGTNLYWQAAP
jgi:hypothetical protein